MDDDVFLSEMLVARLADDPEFMASALSRYQQQENIISSECVAARLGLTRGQLARLALCKRPTTDAPNFTTNIRQIAEFVPWDACDLVGLLRQVEFFERFSVLRTETNNLIDFPSGDDHLSLLAAARDRTEPKPNDPSPGTATE
jgi:hypothetical protein